MPIPTCQDLRPNFQWPATVDWCSVVRHAQQRPLWPGSPPRKIRCWRRKTEPFRTLIMTATLPMGTLLNAAGILIGGIVGLTLRRQLTRPTQVALKGLLGVVVVIVGLKTSWTSLGGGFWLVLKQIAIILLSLIFGRITGRLLHLQQGLNRLGQYAKTRFTRSSVDATQRWSEGFSTCT